MSAPVRAIALDASETREGVHDYAAEVWSSGQPRTVIDTIADEIPIALTYNGVSHAVMLATPVDLEDFGLGFSLSEGIVESAREIHDVEVKTVRAGIEVALEIAGGRFAALKDRRRNLAGRTGCGLCGTESLDQVLRPLREVSSGIVVTGAALHRAFDHLVERQRLNALTGSIHAAGFGCVAGRLSIVREDVGRHNALDKLIGALSRERADFASGFVALTSRASSEMVQKAATVGVPVVAAISAPTGLAIDIARASGVTLVGFVRGSRHVVYAHPHRIDHPSMGEVP